MNNVEHDAEVAEKDSDGNVTANNQDGQTAQEIADDAETAESANYDVTFTHIITVDAVDIDDAVSIASSQWNSRQRYANEMATDIGLVV